MASQILGRPVRYCVLLPASYDTEKARRYPVLYYLHGLGDNEQSLVNFGGWNLVGWTGATAVEDAIMPIAEQVDTLFGWDASAQQFRSFSPSAPPFLNSLETLQFGDGVWIRVENPGGVTWTQPAVVVTRAVPLSAGWNLVLWTGPDGTYVVDAVEEIADGLAALFTWDAAAQRFLSYSPDVPAFLNTARVLNSGDGVWIRLAGAATWNQPAP